MGLSAYRHVANGLFSSDFGMAQPSPYNRAYNFSNWQSAHPADPLPAGPLDEELSRIKQVTDEIRANMALIQRDDTALANRSVGFDQLKTEVQIGVNPPSTWETAKNYIVRDTVFYEQKFYICLVSHVSTTFAADLAAGRWDQIADFTAAQSASLVTYDNSQSGIPATNLQEAVDVIAGSINVSSVFGRSGAVTAQAGDYTAEQVAFDPSGLSGLTADNVQAVIAQLLAAVQSGGAQTGMVSLYALETPPPGWLLCYGQVLTPDTPYTVLRQKLIADGFKYGHDGGGNPLLPDSRGRTPAGKDNMGGVSANRLSLIGGNVLGAAGGSQTHVLTIEQTPAHNHGGVTTANGGHSHSGWTDVQGNHTHAVPTTVGPSQSGAGGFPVAPGAVANPVTYGTTASGLHSHNVGTYPVGDHVHGIPAQGGGQAHNNVQPTLVFNIIIKT